MTPSAAAKSTPVRSTIGSASSSARTATAGPVAGTDPQQPPGAGDPLLAR